MRVKTQSYEHSILLKTFPGQSTEGKPSWTKTAKRKEEDGYSKQARSKISSNSSLVQPSGGSMCPDLMSMASLMMGILHMSLSLISMYLSCFTIPGWRSSTLVRLVLRRIFLRFDPVVVLTSDLAML